MHLSEAFTANSATAGFLGGVGIGTVALGKLWTSGQLMPSATPHPFSTVGFVVGSFMLSNLVAPEAMFERTVDELGAGRVLLSGALVGFGAGLGEGCTSGNGIQGLAALSKSSLIFVCTFMCTGMLTTALGNTTSILPPTAPFGPSLSQLSPLLSIMAVGSLTQFAIGRKMPAIGAAVAGATFACSLIVAGMVKPSRVLGFLNAFDGKAGWDPTLAFVMGGGLLVTLPGYQLFGVVRRAAPEVQAWASRPADLLVVLAGVAFGAGWAISGLCPGPALVACGTGSAMAWLFTGSMFGARHLGQMLRASSSAIAHSGKRS